MNDIKTVARVIRTSYWIGDIVFLRVRGERVQGMVTGVVVREQSVSIAVTWGSSASESWHYEYELTSEYLPNFSD